MPGVRKLPKTTELAVKEHLRKGATLDDTVAWCKKQAFKCSRSSVYNWQREVQAERAALRSAGRAPREAAPEPVAGASAEEVAALLRPQLEAIVKRAVAQQLQGAAMKAAADSLDSEGAIRLAVQVVAAIASNPDEESRIRVQAIAQLPDLAKLLASYEETDDGDDGLEGA